MKKQGFKGDSKPVLYMLIGLPGSGKTSKAREIEAQHSALRLTPDEWILTLYGYDLDRAERDAVRDPVEALQWQIAERMLSLGQSVVLDWGFWSQAERSTYRNRAQALGAQVKMIFLDVPFSELWRRISHRDESQKGTLHITEVELKQWTNIFELPTSEELSGAS